MTTIQKKVCLPGDFAVGKTSLIRRYVEGKFDDKYLSTSAPITDEELAVVAGQHQAPHFVSSAKTGENVETVFLTLGQRIFTRA